jgi:hypothetical protein
LIKNSTRNSTLFRNLTDTTKLIIRSRVCSSTRRERIYHKYISYIMSLWKHWLLGWWYPQQIIIVHQQLHFWFKLFKGKDIFYIWVTWVYMVYRIVSWTCCCCTIYYFLSSILCWNTCNYWQTAANSNILLMDYYNLLRVSPAQ